MTLNLVEVMRLIVEGMVMSGLVQSELPVLKGCRWILAAGYHKDINEELTSVACWRRSLLREVCMETYAFGSDHPSFCTPRSTTANIPGSGNVQVPPYTQAWLLETTGLSNVPHIPVPHGSEFSQ